MPVLSKAELFREVSLPASDEIKKNLSREVKNILSDDLGIEPHFIRNLENTINRTPDSLKENLRSDFSDVMVVPSVKGKYMNYPAKYGKGHPKAGELKPKVLDSNALIVAINAYIDLFEGILEEVNKIPLEMKLRFLEGQLENPDDIREYVDDDIANLLIENRRIYDQIDKALGTLKVFMERFKRNIKPKKAEFTNFNNSLKKAIKEYSVSDLKENWHGSYSEFANAYGFSSQKTVNIFLKNYENGKLAPSTFSILNEEYDGETGIEILKSMLKDVGMKTRTFKYKEETDVQSLFNVDLSKVLKQIEKAMNPSAGFGEIKHFFKLKENKLIDYSETVEIRLLDLLDDEEEVEYYYNVTPDGDKEDNLGVADLQNETYVAEIKVTTKQYAFMYYVAKLRGIELDSSLLTNDISDEYSEDKLEEKFRYVKEAFEEMGEKE